MNDAADLIENQAREIEALAQANAAKRDELEKRRWISVTEALPMTAGEIIADYKQAKRPSAQIKVLAELNCTSEDMIRNILADGGVDVKKKK